MTMQLEIGQLSTIEEIEKFVFAGRAVFTLKSKGTGNRLTFKLARAKDLDNGKKNPVYFVSVLTSPDIFTYLGIVDIDKQSFRRTPKSTIGEDAQSQKTMRWFFPLLFACNSKLLEVMEFWHEGKCGMCGKALTDPESIARGIGPICADKLS